ncbi:hypothetical protein AB0K00_20650 [Dactylosporangium sp. NPDC049525]|uniref:hypothetical protein n=1 Tax=Dactylosporangium sp. NPDC049525 TaxID=3154730 RepID=UPI003446B6D7
MADDDLTVTTRMDKAARLIGRSIVRFRRLPYGWKAAVAAVLVFAVIGVVMAFNGMRDNSQLSFRFGFSYGHGVGSHYGSPAPTIDEIKSGCTSATVPLTGGTFRWVEGGVAYDTNGADVDKEAFIDGCVKGVMSGLRGDPAP